MGAEHVHMVIIAGDVKTKELPSESTDTAQCGLERTDIIDVIFLSYFHTPPLLFSAA